MDPFVSAVDDLSQALAAGEDPDQAIADIAEEHGLAPHALHNRAVRALGPLESFRERQAALRKERERNVVRADPVLAVATLLAEVSNLSPQLRTEERDNEIKRLAAELGVDPDAHRAAIDRVRRRY